MQHLFVEVMLCPEVLFFMQNLTGQFYRDLTELGT